MSEVLKQLAKIRAIYQQRAILALLRQDGPPTYTKPYDDVMRLYSGDFTVAVDQGSPDGDSCAIAKHNEDGTLTIIDMKHKDKP